MAELILVVEDEPALRETLAYNLRKQGYRVEPVGDGRQALALARELRPDLILLDIMLPGLDGLEVCRILRQETSIPIFMLTARDEEVDRVVGLELGADDYMVKPFSMRELLARVKSRLRFVRRVREEAAAQAAPSAAEGLLRFGELSIDPARREVALTGQPVAMKPKEYDLLLFLAQHAGQVVGREQILRSVWGWDYYGDSRTVDVHIRWLREKLEEDPARPMRIVTVRGAGYRFDG